MNHIRHIAVTLLLLSPFGLFAQHSIDSAMKALENAKSVTNEVYSERRNPTTKGNRERKLSIRVHRQ